MEPETKRQRLDTGEESHLTNTDHAVHLEVIGGQDTDGSVSDSVGLGQVVILPDGTEAIVTAQENLEADANLINTVPSGSEQGETIQEETAGQLYHISTSASHQLDEGEMVITESGTVDNQSVEVIQVSSLNDLPSGNDHTKVWQLMPSNLNITTDSVIIIGENNGVNGITAAANTASDNEHLITGITEYNQVNLPSDTPAWARHLRDCEKIGHYYRGWVTTEQDLDIVMTLHKQQTQSFWGTRQSPAGNRPSARMMWKSQYVPFDGIPFINCGSRAVVMECQYGPRRKGGAPSKKTPVDTFKQTCPARIYIKKVRKFPEFRVPTDLDRKTMKINMDKSFASLRMSGFALGGSDRFHVQLPTQQAHEFHSLEGNSDTIQRTFSLREDCRAARLDTHVADKIRDIVSRGVHHVTTVRKMLRRYVEKEMFEGMEVPARHNLSYFPTVNDLQNHIHIALADIDNGTLQLKAPLEIDMLHQDTDIEFNEQWGGAVAPAEQPHPETVTVTLTQNPDKEGHMISKVETHMSDGTTEISTSLTPETAELLARLHPNMFPSIQTVMNTNKGADGEKITELVHSVLSQPTTSQEQVVSESVDSVSVQPSSPPDGQALTFDSLQDAEVVTLNDVQMTD